MKALIIDDERLARLELRRLLKPHAEVEIAGEAANGEEALTLIKRSAPDLLFLDIQMPGMTGFELLEQLDQDVPQVIFTTAFDAYAIKAFEVNALDYLLKPVAPLRLAAALRRISPQRARLPLSRVFVKDGDRCWIVPVSDIVLLQSEDNYTRLYFGAHRPLIRRSLNTLEQQLDPTMFFRANRKQIVNLSSIVSTHVSLSGEVMVILPDGQTVEMSRRRSERLRTWLRL